MLLDHIKPFALLAALLMFAPGGVVPAAQTAGGPAHVPLRQMLETAVRRHVAEGFEKTGLPGELVAVHLPANLTGLHTAVDIKPLRRFLPNKAAGRYVIPLEITLSSGRPLKVNVTAECVAIVRGWAVRWPLGRGTHLGEEQFERKTIRVTRREQNYFTANEMPAGLQLTTSLAGGMLLQAHHLEAIPAVQSGESVEIHFRRRSLTLISPGKARREGNIGELIPVVATVTGKRLYGRLVAPGIVVVE